MKDKILILVPGLGGGGQERIAIQTADILKKQYEPIIVVFSKNNQVYPTTINIINLQLASKKSVFGKIYQQIQRAYALSRIVKKTKPILVFSIGNTANITNAFVKGSHQRVMSLRNYLNVKASPLDRFTYYRSNAIVCISKGIADRLTRLYPKSQNKIKVIYNGLDLDTIRTMSIDNNVGLPNGKKIISVGRLNEIKGFRHLLKSFYELVSQGTDASLIILGEGIEREALSELAKQLQIENKVHFIGFANNPYKYMKHCDLFVLSSINEGFGNVIIEAMACGLPVISTACLSGPIEILNIPDSTIISNAFEAPFGLVVPSFKSDYSNEPEKEKVLANAMKLLLENENLAKHYQSQSYIRAEDFSIKKYRVEILKLIEELTSK